MVSLLPSTERGEPATPTPPGATRGAHLGDRAPLQCCETGCRQPGREHERDGQRGTPIGDSATAMAANTIALKIVPINA
jgi:hypothetical protein